MVNRISLAPMYHYIKNNDNKTGEKIMIAKPVKKFTISTKN